MRGSIVKRGKKYSIVYDVPGAVPRKQKWVSGFETKAEAEFALNKIIYESSCCFTGCEYTVSSWLSYWINIHRTNISLNTLNGYLVNINHINKYVGSVSLSLLSPLKIQNMYSDMLKSLSGTSVLYIHRVLKMALQYAVNIDVIPKNPCNNVSVPRKNKFTASVLSDEQLRTLLDYCRDTDLYIPVLLASLLGLRRGEIIGLKRSDLDINNLTLTISRSGIYKNGERVIFTTKSETSCRTLLLSPEVVSILSEIYTEYFISLTDGQLNKRFSKALSDCNLPHIRFHDLRHTYATLLLKQGIPAKIVSERLGHSSIQITLDTYSHVLTSMQSESASALDDFLLDNGHS